MATTKIDHSGKLQSVELPEGFQFDVDEVEILRRGDEVILRKKDAQVGSSRPEVDEEDPGVHFFACMH
jgi:virulence-associated protein VagC